VKLLLTECGIEVFVQVLVSRCTFKVEVSFMRLLQSQRGRRDSSVGIVTRQQLDRRIWVTFRAGER